MPLHLYDPRSLEKRKNRMRNTADATVMAKLIAMRKAKVTDNVNSKGRVRSVTVIATAKLPEKDSTNEPHLGQTSLNTIPYKYHPITF
uniref:Uncharacterized protein n=1 Tax=Sphaerodactylus townsendi TaxID=933632 RepID=A0ACB8G504_9SAUR